MEMTLNEKISSLYIDAFDYDVCIKSSEHGGSCVVIGEKIGEDFENIRVENGNLEIIRKKNNIFNKLFGNLGKNKRLTVMLPEGKYESCTLKIASGDVDVNAGYCFGNMKVEVVSGDICIDSVCVENDAEFSAVSGDIRSSNLSCSRLRVKNTSGDVSICGATASECMSLESVSGDVCPVDVLAGSLKLRTISGDINGTLGKEYNYSVHSVSGTVSIPESMGERHCDIRTTSGDVKIKWSEQ